LSKMGQMGVRIGLVPPFLFESKTKDLAHKIVQGFGQSDRVSQEQLEGWCKTSQDLLEAHITDFAFGEDFIGDAQGCQQEMNDDNPNHLGVEFGQYSFFAPAQDRVETAVTLPEFENEFDLPTHAIEVINVFETKHALWRIGHK